MRVSVLRIAATGGVGITVATPNRLVVTTEPPFCDMRIIINQDFGPMGWGKGPIVNAFAHAAGRYLGKQMTLRWKPR